MISKNHLISLITDYDQDTAHELKEPIVVVFRVDATNVFSFGRQEGFVLPLQVFLTVKLLQIINETYRVQLSAYWLVRAEEPPVVQCSLLDWYVVWKVSNAQ